MDLATRKILEICRNIEETCAKIYFYLADCFAEDEAVRKLWQKTAYEEVNHANIIGLALNCRDMDLQDRTYDLFRYQTQLNIVTEIHASVVRARPSLADALRSSIHLEKKLQEFHVNCLLAFQHEQDRQLFQSLQNGDREHLEALEKTYRSLLAAHEAPSRPRPSA